MEKKTKIALGLLLIASSAYIFFKLPLRPIQDKELSADGREEKMSYGEMQTLPPKEKGNIN